MVPLPWRCCASWTAGSDALGGRRTASACCHLCGASEAAGCQEDRSARKSVAPVMDREMVDFFL